jgi:hypothetical protein
VLSSIPILQGESGAAGPSGPLIIVLRRRRDACPLIELPARAFTSGCRAPSHPTDVGSIGAERALDDTIVGASSVAPNGASGAGEMGPDARR